jgi:glycosyltransferase involved in cell wall biosynthesis
MLMDIARRNPRLRIEAAGFNEAPIPGLPPNIYLHGHLTGDRLTGFYHHARFLVIPSRCYEGFPLVALEAMALGRTVIAPDHGGFSDILGKGPEAIGRLFRPNDCMDLESAILQLWQNEKLTKELGKRCFEKIKTSYTSEIVYRQWEQLFLELLQTQNN